MAQEKPMIHELKPAKTIAEAVAKAKEHVNAVNKAAGTSGGGGGGGGGRAHGKGPDK